VVQFTARLMPVYILVILELGSRRIAWVNATTSPSLDWVKAQIRQACPFDGKPKFLIHDNDGIFGQFRKREQRRTFRGELGRWLRQVMGVHGIPIPYGAPKANAFCERFNRTLRQQLLAAITTLSPR
jgi:hypothetical protein